jgi:tetratricopeptide (TPR) repeat protein
LRAFLEAQALYRGGKHTDAIRRYERALRLDSTFALAALHLALATDRLQAPQHERAIALAWAARDDFNERDRALIEAFAGSRYPAPSSEAERVIGWERAASLASDLPAVWHELGERYFHYGAVLGLPDGYARATSAFTRALALDPGFTPSRRLAILAAARAGDLALLDRLASPAALRDSLGDLAPAFRWRVALARGDSTALDDARATFGRLDAANLRLIAMATQLDGVAPDDGERAVRLLRARVDGGAGELDVLSARHSLAINQGRPAVALDVTEQIQRLEPGSRAHLRLRILDALYAEGDTALATAWAMRLDRAANGAPVQVPAARALQLADRCVLGQWHLARNGARAAQDIRSTIEQLRAAAPRRQTALVMASSAVCAELLETSLAVSTGARDALDRVKHLDSLAIGSPPMGDASAYLNIAVARMYERLNQSERALAAIRRRPYLTVWPRYLATARRIEGRLALLAGDAEGAARAYDAYLAFRSDPEASVAVQVDSVRSARANSSAKAR